MTKHFDYLDFAKGIGIILVIMGHSLFPLHFAIDVFHMPLFFVLSGMSYKRPDSKVRFLIKKINRIGIPYIFFMITSCIISLFFSPLVNTPFNGPLWFLQTIFVALLIYVLIDFICDKNVVLLGFVIVFFSIYSYLVARYSVEFLPFNLDRAMCAVVFIHLGRCIGLRNILPSSIYFRLITLGCLISVFIMGVYYSMIKYDLDGASFVNTKVYSYNYLLFYITSVSAILFTLLMSKWINSLKFINYLGVNSLIILCVHFPLIERLNIFVSKTTLYNSGINGKIICGLMIYIIVIIFSLICIFLSKKYFPKLTGYQSYLIQE